MELFKDIGRNSKPPPNFPDETIQDEVCKCHESAFYDVRSKVDRFQVPHGKRKTLWTRPLLMGAEEIGHFVTGWYFHQFEGYRHVMTVVRKAGEAGLQDYYRRAYDQKMFQSSIQFLNGTGREVESLELPMNFISGLFSNL